MIDESLKRHALIMSLSDDLRAQIKTVLEAHLSDALVCTRTWDAWSVGTMREDDFEEFLNEPLLEVIVNDVISAILNHNT